MHTPPHLAFTYSLDPVTKYPTENNLRVEGFILAYVLQMGTGIMAGRVLGLESHCVRNQRVNRTWAEPLNPQVHP